MAPSPTPISCLPPELLSPVFRCLSHKLPLVQRYDEYREGFTEYEKSDPLSTWVKVTHVSHFFREVALGDPSLWTEISTIHGASWARASLDRSGRHPVLLDVGEDALSAGYDGPVWKEAIARAHTIQCGRSGFKWQKHLLESDAPSLVSLRVQTNSYDDDAILYGGGKCPDCFLRGSQNSGTFRELDLCGFAYYRWSDLARYSALASLKLGVLGSDYGALGSSYWAHTDVPVGGFLDTLSRLQKLETLVLLRIAPLTTGDKACDFDEHVDSVHLPSLRLVRLQHCHTNTLLALFNDIVFPADARVELVPNGDWWTDAYEGIPSIQIFKDILGRRLSMPPWDDFRTLVVSSEENLPEWMQHECAASGRSVSVLAWRAEFDPHNVFRSCKDGDSQSSEPNPNFCLRASYSYEHKEQAVFADDILGLFKNIPTRTQCFLPPSTHQTTNALPERKSFEFALL